MFPSQQAPNIGKLGTKNTPLHGTADLRRKTAKHISTDSTTAHLVGRLISLNLRPLYPSGKRLCLSLVRTGRPIVGLKVIATENFLPLHRIQVPI